MRTVALVLLVLVTPELVGQTNVRILHKDGSIRVGTIAEENADYLILMDSSLAMVRIYFGDIHAIDLSTEVTIKLISGGKIKGTVYYSDLHQAANDSTLELEGGSPGIRIAHIKRIRWRKPPRASVLLGGLTGVLAGLIPVLLTSSPESQVPGIIYVVGLATIGALVGNWATIESIPIHGNYDAYRRLLIMHFPSAEVSRKAPKAPSE